jgi:FAD/FMN-containing dehydrogenase
MNRILELDVRNRRARVQPGLINLDLSRAIAGAGVFYAPDPSSQKISTIGGNVGTNAGGPHCLSYGTTTNHVLGLQFVDDEGEVHRCSIDDPGYDLTGVLVGSEGTLGIVTEIDVRLMKLPEEVRVCVAAFGDVESASEAVSAIIGAGIVPTALEIMDALITRAVEAHYHAGYPARTTTSPPVRRCSPRSRNGTVRSPGAPRATRPNATRFGPRAKARPARSAASRRTTTSRMPASRARASPR